MVQNRVVSDEFIRPVLINLFLDWPRTNAKRSMTISASMYHYFHLITSWTHINDKKYLAYFTQRYSRFSNISNVIQQCELIRKPH